ncbi:MAG: kynureninase [Catalinimonas sp.]
MTAPTYDALLDDARARDAADPLRRFRDEFLLPEHEGRPALYFCGNSLGLQPKGVAAAVQIELDDWARLGVEGHFRGRNPWVDYHRRLAEPLGRIVGARPGEVVAMNALTVNLHLLLVSFYRPTAGRYKIIVEGGAFPSDQYALASQVRHHGFDPDDAIVELHPRPGEHGLRTEDITAAIGQTGEALALVMMGGVNYYTGQWFDLPAITAAGHKVGATVGFDLAHAAGNVVLNLHDWNVDFAAWCTYKYLNSGPGGVAGAFVHERHARAFDLPRFAGWWGHDEATRFRMDKIFRPMPGAEGWQLSNAPILAMAAHRAALDVFDAAGGMGPLRKKSEALTGYLYHLLRDVPGVRVITPADPAARGCQLSLLTGEDGRAQYERLARAGVVVDRREPNVIRVAPTPLYNTFEEAYRFARLLRGETAPVSSVSDGSDAAG